LSEGTQQTKQTGNLVGGDQAGGDIYKDNVFQVGPVTPMSQLIAKYREECKNDADIRQTIEQLRRYQLPPEGEVIGLEVKLRQGGRVELLHFALVATDLKHEFSPAAQEIYVHLLAKVWQLFQQVVYPAICRGATPAEIDRLLADQIYAKVEALLESNPLKIQADEIMGMLYWLTGNCHLKWKNHADLQSSV
jgi:CRISPR/Cas system-associated protein endoribonuclease Cas2